jgi:hypothetical protein
MLRSAAWEFFDVDVWSGCVEDFMLKHVGMDDFHKRAKIENVFSASCQCE